MESTGVRLSPALLSHLHSPRGRGSRLGRRPSGVRDHDWSRPCRAGQPRV